MEQPDNSRAPLGLRSVRPAVEYTSVPVLHRVPVIA